jgi:hypothetical protein
METMDVEHKANLLTRVVAVGEKSFWVVLYVAVVLLVAPAAWALLLLAVPFVASLYLVWRTYRSEPEAVSATGAVVREQRCSVLYVHVAEGVTSEQGYAIRDALDKSETIGWWFLNPGSFVVVFPTPRETERLSSCRAALARLAVANPEWPVATYGEADGTVFGAFNGAGILESMPSGKVVTLAMNNAIEAA